MADGGAVAPRPAAVEVGDVFRAHGAVYRRHHPMSDRQSKVMRAIQQCRTSALGGHLQVCSDCGFSQPAYNSCRDRHCPKCQSVRQALWLEQRRERLLPVPYFHVVFTLPGSLRRLCRRNDREMYNLLFAAASQTLLRLGQDPKWLGGRLAITTVLHTWTRELQYHPHLHCIVTAGGLSPDGTRWIFGSTRYLFPVAVLSALFRGLFLDGLKKLVERDQVRLDGQDFPSLLDALYRESWVVYAKRPFGGPEQVFRYLGRYTHRVGISNQRLISMDEQGVCFATKNGKKLTLPPQEFIRRFLLHVLPEGFVKTRHYGLWASGKAQQALEVARTLLQTQRERAATLRPLGVDSDSEEDAAPKDESDAQDESDAENFVQRLLRLCGMDVSRCPACQTGRLVREPLPHQSLATGIGSDTS
ncbi:IS91 family transposase [Haliangium sp. UPWRP_2]|uniref:IS91 family transposase n=1 Tax=Haliangium sp. UPWRP_2 TaxID=1931276 RepID=UPI000B5453F3|nr:IS91 family transposase [Haliangium sp. UPWRP_2]PSM31773.1 IS91 family transposase [Haliangium sp. UPWRP_2]